MSESSPAVEDFRDPADHSPEAESSVGDNPETTGEQLTDAVPFHLTEAERTILTRFLMLVDDEGVQAILALRVANSYKGSSDIPAQALGTALEDLDKTCVKSDRVFPDNIIMAAPSMALVCMYLKSNPIGSLVVFPPEFIPDENLVHKCLSAYFARLSAAADEMVADQAS